MGYFVEPAASLLSAVSIMCLPRVPFQCCFAVTPDCTVDLSLKSPRNYLELPTYLDLTSFQDISVNTDRRLCMKPDKNSIFSN